jgi:hypothetical protein
LKPLSNNASLLRIPLPKHPLKSSRNEINSKRKASASSRNSSLHLNESQKSIGEEVAAADEPKTTLEALERMRSSPTFARNRELSNKKKLLDNLAFILKKNNV